MGRKGSTLSLETCADVWRRVFHNCRNGERIALLRLIKRCSVEIDIDQAVSVMFALNREICCDQRIRRPVQKPSWQPMMLRNGEPLPRVPRGEFKVWKHLLLEAREQASLDL